jgi:uncharacterized OB-fold protein
MTASIDGGLRVLGADLLAPTSASPAIGEAIQLLACRCADCSRVEFPRRDRCPACSGAMFPHVVASEGSIRGFTQVTAAPPGALIAPPYHVAIVAFADEGISIMGLLSPDGAEPWLGCLVTTVLVEVAPGVATYGFRLG